MWHTVNTAVKRWGEALLAADTARISDVEAVGLDETLLWRRGRLRAKTWATSIVDVGRGQLLDIVPGRSAQRRPHAGCCAGAESGARASAGRCWTSRAPTAPRSTPRCPKPDRSLTPSTSCGWETTPSTKCGWETTPSTKCDGGSRTRRWDTAAAKTTRCIGPASCSSQRPENITAHGHTKLRGLLDAGDPYGEVRDAWHAKETLRSVDDIPCAKVGAATVAQLAADLQEPGLLEEINRFGRTIATWRTQISNWHAERVTNAPPKQPTTLIKRVKRAAFGFTNFDNYRIRALLYAGKPNWALLDTLTPT